MYEQVGLRLIHILLDLAGMVPLVGAPADLANGMLYASERDHFNAALSYVGVIPLIGELATPLRYADEGAGLFKGACSFSGDTEVLMADGTHKPIQDIQVGDQVWAADPDTGEAGPRTVTATWAHEDTVYDLLLDNGATITTTEDHPYYNTTTKTWQRADQLTPGDHLHTTDGNTISLTGLQPTTARTNTAYNLTVDKVHTYYVQAGAASVLVHNTCGMSISSAQLQKKYKHAADFGIIGHWNPGNAAKFEAALKSHVNDPGNLRLSGTYHGEEVVHHLNPHTGVNVMHLAASSSADGG